MTQVLEEIMRAKLPVRPDVLRRWQAAIRDEVLPVLAQLPPPTVTTSKTSKGAGA